MKATQKGRVCRTSWCDRECKCKGLCGPCYIIEYKGGDPEIPRRPKVDKNATNDERLRFIGWTETEAGCWEWDGRRDKKEYGVMSTREKKQVFAHRTAYETWVGPIPDGLSILHRCDNPPCINPEHLWPGTQQENIDDMTMKEHGNTRKLTADDVRKMRLRAALGEKIPSIIKDYPVSDTTGRAAIAGRTWKHV